MEEPRFMPGQQFLFIDESAKGLSRASDPETSKQTGREIVKDGTRGRLQRLALEAVRRYPGRTAKELAVLVEFPEIHKRMKELERKGLIYSGPSRRCGITNRNATTYYPI